jgi:hypothetical protein
MTTTEIELHTTDLTEPCLRKTYLRHQGRAFGEMSTALYRGCLWHAAVLRAHDPAFTLADAVLLGAADVEREAREEGRPLTDAVVTNRPLILAEIENLLAAYRDRFLPTVASEKLIGFELPIRLVLDVDGEPQSFASHIDYLARRANGRLVCRDWKTQEESPTAAYLARNIQLAMYYVAILEGEVMLPDGEWVAFGEHADFEWVHVNNLAPYGRATKSVDDNGEERQFAKGEARPLHTVVKFIDFDETKVGRIKSELELRARMWRAGMFPASPEPVKCFLCECRGSCGTYVKENNETF